MTQLESLNKSSNKLLTQSDLALQELRQISQNRERPNKSLDSRIMKPDIDETIAPQRIHRNAGDNFA